MDVALYVVELKIYIMLCEKDAEYTHCEIPLHILRTSKTNLYN